ncbi:hypothetical protein K432DRAFT_454304 [Lepidopterella palustris CBS 459.81]|uniref:Uncharacterized protein n=1 Tax=Lepidopterella palustris CBS 459.81 TaxID=1314670 RepID=A0A8E2E9S6_9PEZI|nr:hypothetical protein K432DRAFT_454304 [Lepidopterella palustris CBS 459.81]
MGQEDYRVLRNESSAEPASYNEWDARGGFRRQYNELEESHREALAPQVTNSSSSSSSSSASSVSYPGVEEIRTHPQSVGKDATSTQISIYYDIPPNVARKLSSGLKHIEANIRELLVLF